MNEARRALELNLAVSRAGAGTLRSNLADALRAAIRDGRLQPGDRLPSTRSLAGHLGVSRGVTSDVYQELAVGGYIELRDRAAALIRSAAVEDPTVSAGSASSCLDALPGGPRYSFAPVAGDLSLFPRGDWLRATRAVLRTATDADLDHGDPTGHPRLRAELSAYLRRTRGVIAVEDRVLITQGNTQALDIVFRTLAARGARRVALENPGYGEPWLAARRAGLHTVALDVDTDGARTDALGDIAADAVLLSPARQFPLGHTLSAERRFAFVDWATASGGFLIEDDYEGELSLDPVPALSLQSLAPESVIFMGTASTMLAPALRLGWVVAPAEIALDCAELKLHSDRGSPAIDQLAFAELIHRGLLDHHLRRVRAAYRERRKLVIDGLMQRVPHALVREPTAGAHVTILLPGIVDEDAILAAARTHDIAIHTLAEFTFAPHSHGAGIVIGYARLSTPALSQAIETLASAICDAHAACGVAAAAPRTAAGSG